MRRVERDSYRHWHRWCALDWSGIELAIVLRKRMEVLAGYTTNEDRSPEQRLEEIMTHKRFSKLPANVSFEYNGVTYSMPLFLYVLRHTFWRPREVLLYYAALLALTEQMARWGHEVTTDVVRKCVKSTTTRVIESEFINEFQSTVRNIRDIIKAFQRSSAMLTYEQLHGRIANVDFLYAVGGLGGDTIREKIHFLYEIGFLGIYADKALRDEYALSLEHVFIFNEGQSALLRADDDEMQKWLFVIHPIFTEYLRLQRHNRELTLRFTWEYLHVAEALFAACPHV